jgi:hypothetical protein
MNSVLHGLLFAGLLHIRAGSETTQRVLGQIRAHLNDRRAQWAEHVTTMTTPPHHYDYQDARRA